MTQINADTLTQKAAPYLAAGLFLNATLLSLFIANRSATWVGAIPFLGEILTALIFALTISNPPRQTLFSSGHIDLAPENRNTMTTWKNTSRIFLMISLTIILAWGCLATIPQLITL